MKQSNIKKNPLLVASDGQGQVFEIPGYEMAAMRINERLVPAADELIPMPHGSVLMELPGRKPIGYNRRSNRFEVVEQYQGIPLIAVAAFLAPAYTQLYRAAYQTLQPAVKLPLFAYTPVGWKKDGFQVTAVRVDQDIRQDLVNFDDKKIETGAKKTLQKYPNNRLVDHLVNHCVRLYHCPAAQNFVQDRWECPAPTSPSCNARCIGCISKQEGSDVPASQDRLSFVPTVEEIVEFTVPHLEQAPRAVISFGQGCEGEPLLQGNLLEEAIREIRRRTDCGTINLNTNACYPYVVEKLCRAGLDSIRVSMNSAQPDLYAAYYRPRDYSFADVQETMRVMRRHHKWISLNYFIFPGLTDDADELQALAKIVAEHTVDYIQMRNLNIDPELYSEALGLTNRPLRAIGILQWQKAIREKAPWLRFGYFNPPKEDWYLNLS